MSALAGNAAAVRNLRAASRALQKLPTVMAQAYANGAPGQTDPIVADRYKGQGNSRFAPLSTEYALWKQGKSKELKKKLLANWGHGAKLLKVEHRARRQGIDVGGFAKGSLPILVLGGKLRAVVASARNHPITQAGDVATITFRSVPDYGKWLRSGTKRMPARTPVDPNEADLERVKEFGERWLSLQVGGGSASTTYGGGTARTTP